MERNGKGVYFIFELDTSDLAIEQAAQKVRESLYEIIEPERADFYEVVVRGKCYLMSAQSPPYG